MNKINEEIQDNKWYTVSDLIKLSDIGLFPCCSKIHIRRLFQTGKLKGVDVGAKSLKQWRITGEAIKNFVNGDSNSKEVLEDTQRSEIKS